MAWSATIVSRAAVGKNIPAVSVVTRLPAVHVVRHRRGRRAGSYRAEHGSDPLISDTTSAESVVPRGQPRRRLRFTFDSE
jgi:hypothetical protein